MFITINDCDFMFSEDLTNKSEKEKTTEERISTLGSLLHDEWRSGRWAEATQNFEPRIKQTKDANWSAAHENSTEVDIANTDYDNLPEDWKGENKKSAEVAVIEVERAIRDGMPLDDQFLEEASSALHDKWLERNGSWAPPEQNVPYAELSEEEKEKDRVIIRKAIEICGVGQPE